MSSTVRASRLGHVAFQFLAPVFFLFLALVFLAPVACVGSIAADGNDQGTPGAPPSNVDGKTPDAPSPSTGGPSPTTGGPSPTTGGAPPSTGAPVPFSCNAGVIDPGPSPLRLLTPVQYLNTVRDLVGAVPSLSALFADLAGAGQGAVSQVALETYQRAADLVASYVVGNAAALAKVAPCDAGAAPRSCAQTFVQTFGARAYRAPLTTADVDRHLPLYDLGAQSGGYSHGIEILLRAMLQAGRFLYQVELGTAEKVSEQAVKLSGFEMAARLSYGIWETAPDATLTAAAARGELGTRAGVAAQLGRMLQDARGKNTVRNFLEGWIGLAGLDDLVKDPKLYPDWNKAAFRSSLKTQARTFFDSILSTQGGKLSALLTSPTVFVNKDVAPLYGMTGGDAFQAVDRADGSASGMLTLPALLASLSKPDVGWPIYRGVFVRESLLCQQLPAPPDNVGNPPDPKPGVTTRQRLAMHRTDPACGGCHALIDPIGFGFENYDGIGRYRTADAVGPIDATGEIVGSQSTNGKFTGVAELGRKLAGSPEVQACAVKQWFRSALDRFEQDADACSLKTLYEGLRAANGDLGSLPQAFVQTDAFLYRRPLPPEVSP